MKRKDLSREQTVRLAAVHEEFIQRQQAFFRKVSQEALALEIFYIDKVEGILIEYIRKPKNAKKK